jgi:ectoine hydroxylase-related dioxygenase (phytanoyl-CoA dioxygenase family)
MTATLKDTKLPTPTTDLDEVKRDLDEFGYGLLRDALTPQQLPAVRDRILEQAECEAQAGVAVIGDGGMRRQNIAADDGSSPHQIVRMLLNKGSVFHEVAQQPDVLRLMEHMLGRGFLLSSSVGIVMRGGSAQQMLHTDQIFVPFTTPVPLVANVIYMVTDFDGARGGTRVVPGTHRGAAPVYEQITEDGKVVGVKEPDADWIPVEGPAGTALVFDGRLWHGGGANVSGDLRLALSNYYGTAYMRQNDLLPLGLNDDVLASMTDEFKTLCGFDTLMPGGGGLGRIDPGAGRHNVSIQWPLISELHRN